MAVQNGPHHFIATFSPQSCIIEDLPEDRLHQALGAPVLLERIHGAFQDGVRIINRSEMDLPDLVNRVTGDYEEGMGILERIGACLLRCLSYILCCIDCTPEIDRLHDLTIAITATAEQMVGEYPLIFYTSRVEGILETLEELAGYEHPEEDFNLDYFRDGDNLLPLATTLSEQLYAIDLATLGANQVDRLRNARADLDHLVLIQIHNGMYYSDIEKLLKLVRSDGRRPSGPAENQFNPLYGESLAYQVVDAAVQSLLQKGNSKVSHPIQAWHAISRLQGTFLLIGFAKTTIVDALCDLGVALGAHDENLQALTSLMKLMPNNAPLLKKVKNACSVAGKREWAEQIQTAVRSEE